ncbi:kinesin-like protein-like protein bimC [Xylona heveae TC161]|uniref:Kinesin-like protein-like protein bimC n=1 Tax=Xylona heveae (strain CBS 132557 / TC161) TaxID=1328760 RepID=A0A165I144_XYLHT|nr:kinesin-like protein-like protein bimC [Xylona heveae TC161]KZF24209.1 kinesin-like protein-like protein bimC [Xylona heveae TC161]
MNSVGARPYGRGASPVATTTPADTPVTRSPAVAHSGMKRKTRDYEPESDETNIHVVVRCRGRNDREVRENSGVVLSTEGVKGKFVELSMGPSALSNKTYNFDKVFSPAADQAMIYEDVVAPILSEMLAGYNCTIFAYGQTGTGKTYTMSGDMSDSFGLLSDSAGIIPRVLHSLFAKLEGEETESSVKCSFIELYNEDLRDLLAADESTKLKIFDDNKKGHSSTIVQGMEETHIKTAADGINLLQNGSYKRQVAATKCNDLSSRSHTVFTVTVYIKQPSETGDDFVSAGKLNLVDLAGSENIQRSGAENKRAAEAGLINKSLLTLGRVINALVDKNSHIPYRESKLTRLLQDSLGGHTKTCIIATVSPAKSNLEETISTLDYAFRAKNIRNKPQLNQLVSKKTLLRDFTVEIEKLKSELIATRQRNGVYLTNEHYEGLTVESESRRILCEEQKAKIETMEASLRNKVQELFSLVNTMSSLKKNHEEVKIILGETKTVLEETQTVLANTRQELTDETIVSAAHEKTERQLRAIGSELLTTLGQAVTDNDGLHAKLRRRSELHNLLRADWQSSQAQVTDITHLLEMRLRQFQDRQKAGVSALSTRMEGFVRQELRGLDETQTYLQETMESLEHWHDENDAKASESRSNMNEVLEEIKVLREEVKERVGQGLNGLAAAAARISAGVISELEDFQETQMRGSHNSIETDLRNIFSKFATDLEAQKTECDNLRREASQAAKAAADANEVANFRLEAVLVEERQQSASDRQNLLTQITALVNATGEAQEARLASKINSIQTDISASTLTFGNAEARYNQAMDAWSLRGEACAKETFDAYKLFEAKLNQDWQSMDAQNEAIQVTTKSVHEETVRIVDAQMADMSNQMKALDEFVTRARSQNEDQYESHVRSLHSVATRVRESNSRVCEHFGRTVDNVEALDQDMSVQRNNLTNALVPLDTGVRQPLADLRSRINGAPLKEYRPTGQTPKKVEYQYQRILPQTKDRKTLLATMNETQIPTTPHDDPTNMSPSKASIYTDADDEVMLLQTMDVDQNSASPADGLTEVDGNAATKSPVSDSEVQAPTENQENEDTPRVKRQRAFESKLPQKSRKGSTRAESRPATVLPKRRTSTRRRSSA